MTFDQPHKLEHIGRLTGGILPVYVENERDEIAACSCHIGLWMAERYRLRMYDSIPGTSKADTKHGLVMAHWRRQIKADAPAQAAAEAIAKADAIDDQPPF